jgi:hypothetical protein
VKPKNAKPAVPPPSSSADQKFEDDLRKLAPRFSQRADDWLLAGDWLAAGERLKKHQPQFKSR